MEPSSQDSPESQHHHPVTPFQKVENGVEALFNGEKHSHVHLGHICDHLHPNNILNRYKSFAPQTTGHAKWYVDGCSYFWAVSQALERAQKSIYILDWWLSPELYLRRPPSKNTQYRLDVMLKAAAERGVTVNVIIYKEVELALTIDSSYTKKTLEALHPNIHVFRHPDHVLTGYNIKSEFTEAFKNFTHFDIAQASDAAVKAIYGVTDDVVLYWSHHEKLLIVDHHLCFMGGLDLCFGRWDTNSHPIADAHPGDLDAIIFPGQDYNNARILDFSDVYMWKQNKLNRTKNSRMGWSDVALCMTGDISSNLVNHFVDRWNYLYRIKYKEKSGSKYQDIQHPGAMKELGQSVKHTILSPRKTFSKGLRRLNSLKKGGREEEIRIQATRSCTHWSSGHPTEHSIANAYIDAILKAKQFVYIENQFFITATSNEQQPVVNKIGAAIVQRICHAHTNGERFKIWVMIPAVPAFAGDLKSNQALGPRAIMKYQYNSICRGGHSILEKLRQAGIQDPSEYIGFYNLRSFDRINTSVTMKIAQEKAGIHYEEARKEHDDQVNASTLPYKGSTFESESSAKKYQQVARDTADKTKDSVSAAYMDAREELADFSWDGDAEAEMDAFVSEELYIHSKLLIADDRLVICGSANLNDRSQLGTHDSEIAVVIEDGPLVPSVMDGQPCQVPRFATSLRRQIFRKHLGLLPDQDPERPDANWHPIDGDSNDDDDDASNEYDWGSPADILVRDPLHANFDHLWRGTAKTNTEVFRKAFHAVPDDSVRSWEDYDEFYSKHFKSSLVEELERDDEHVLADERKAANVKHVQMADQPSSAQLEATRGEDEAVQSPAATEGRRGKLAGEKRAEYGHVVRSEFPGGVRELRVLLGRVRGTLVEMPLNFLAEVEDIARTGLTLNSLTEEIYT